MEFQSLGREVCKKEEEDGAREKRNKGREKRGKQRERESVQVVRAHACLLSHMVLRLRMNVGPRSSGVREETNMVVMAAAFLERL